MSSYNVDNPEPPKELLQHLVKKEVGKIYGPTIVTRILAVIGLICLLALFTVAVLRLIPDHFFQ